MTSLLLAHRAQPYLADVTANQARLQQFLDHLGLDLLLITAQDAYLSEYNPLQNHHRYALTGFSGSTGDGYFLTPQLQGHLGLKAPFVLFIDGRYHLQAEQQTDPAQVHLEKLPLTQPLEKALIHWLAQIPAGTRLGVDGARVTWKRLEQIRQIAQAQQFHLKVLLEDEISQALHLPGWPIDRPISPVGAEVTGHTLQERVQGLGLPAKSCLITCKSDDIAWILGARGYHMPQASSFFGYGLLLESQVFLYLPPGVDQCPVTVPGVTVIRSREALIQRLQPYSIQEIWFSDRAMQGELPQLALQIWPQAHLKVDFHGLEAQRTAKTPQELHAIRSAFLKSSVAIARTLRWVKASFKTDQLISEWDLSQRISQEYQGQGAIELSFKSIAATGANGAIIHYGTPSPENILQPGDLTLLDSGAYYAEGFATDCTRVVFCGNPPAVPQSWQKEVYTVTLKAAITGLRAVFPEDTPCQVIDQQVRGVCQHYGYDYNHGTGHGVGILVHESGIRLAPDSVYGFTENAVVSIEPGIYLPGKGGVRIENVAVVRRQRPGYFCFENLAFVGLDWDLIDLSLLDEAEKIYLRDYEVQCQGLGTAVTSCPL